MTIVTCEIQWLTYLLQDFKGHFEQTCLLYYDNDSPNKIHCSKFNFSQAYKTHTNILSRCQGKIEEFHLFVFHFHHRATG